MKKHFFALLMSLLPMGLVSGVSYAAPGDANTQPGVEVLEPSRPGCAIVGSLCVVAGAPTTLAMNPTDTAARTLPPAQFVRIGADKNKAAVDDDVPWTLDVHATLRRPALAGNALFLVYDAEDRAAIAAHEVTGMWQAAVPAGDKLSARLSLSPEDGFHAGHTYLIRVAQIIRGRETVLAEGEVRLM